MVHGSLLLSPTPAPEVLRPLQQQQKVSPPIRVMF
jgi:hypothetical protein